MKNILVTSCISSILYLTTVGCSSVYDKHVEWESVKPESFPVLHAIGQAPISAQNSPNKTQRMLMAMRASKLAAYAELTEQVYGQQINDQTSMSNLSLGNQELKASVQGVIRGAKVIKSYPVGDSYTTELSLDFKDVYDILASSAPRKKIKDVQYF